MARHSLEGRSARHPQAALGCGLDDGLSERMLAVTLRGGDHLEYLVLVNAVRGRDGDDLGLAAGERAGLVEDDRVDGGADELVARGLFDRQALAGYRRLIDLALALLDDGVDGHLGAGTDGSHRNRGLPAGRTVGDLTQARPRRRDESTTSRTPRQRPGSTGSNASPDHFRAFRRIETRCRVTPKRSAICSIVSPSA
jgi:hypothetical protein